MSRQNNNQENRACAPRSSRDLRSFGRKRGRSLSARQRALLEHELPRFKLDLENPPPKKLENLFDLEVTSLWLEIGFGAAEHLIWQARENPQTGIIGCEPYIDGVVKALSAINEHGLKNIRLHDDDVRDALRWLPPACLDRVFILFPDPWPKARHRKRRLVNLQMFQHLAHTMAPGAQLIIATDIKDYARTILIAAQKADEEFLWQADSPQDWRTRPGLWPPTRYEQKAAREGRTPYFFTFQRREMKL